MDKSVWFFIIIILFARNHSPKCYTTLLAGYVVLKSLLLYDMKGREVENIF